MLSTAKSALITQSNYIPWKGYFDGIAQSDVFVLYDDMQYTRRDWRNRNKIKTAQGTLWLTIPVDVKGKYFQSIRDTKVADPQWGVDHWKSIEMNYRRAACFKEYGEAFKELYLNPPSEYLSEINFTFIQLICSILEIKTEFRWSSEFALADDRTQRLVDICVATGCTEYYTGPAAKAYMDESLFTAAGVHINYFDYSGYPPYTQLFGDFVHEVSVIDLILNEGANAVNFLKYAGHEAR